MSAKTAVLLSFWVILLLPAAAQNDDYHLCEQDRESPDLGLGTALQQSSPATSPQSNLSTHLTSAGSHSP